jgi:hypothetical protein
MEAYSSETLVDYQRTTRRYIPEDRTLQLLKVPIVFHVYGYYTIILYFLIKKYIKNARNLYELFHICYFSTHDFSWHSNTRDFQPQDFLRYIKVHG